MKQLIILALGMILSSQCYSQNAKINLGNLKVNHSKENIDDVRTFYKNVLGAKIVTPKSLVPRDYIQFDNGFRINIIYTDKEKAPTQESFIKGLWIRIDVEDFDKKAEKIKASKIKIIRDLPKKKELYFQAPGGQVYRMVGV